MSHGYRAVGWTPHKKLYDLVLAGGVAVYLALFVALGISLDANATIETQLIRAFGTCALLLLHVILATDHWPVSTAGSCRCSTTGAISESPCSASRSVMGPSAWCSSTRSATCIHW